MSTYVELSGPMPLPQKLERLADSPTRSISTSLSGKSYLGSLAIGLEGVASLVGIHHDASAGLHITSENASAKLAQEPALDYSLHGASAKLWVVALVG